MEAFCSIWREYEGEFDSICKFCLKHNRKLTNPISCFGGSSLFQRILLWRNTLHYNMSPLDLENWDFLAIHRAFCCCVFSLSGSYTAARCVKAFNKERAPVGSFFRHCEISRRFINSCSVLCVPRPSDVTWHGTAKLWPRSGQLIHYLLFPSKLITWSL